MKKKKLSLIVIVLFMGIFAENAMAAEAYPNVASKESKEADTRLSSTSVSEEQRVIAEAAAKVEAKAEVIVAGVKAAMVRVEKAEVRAERAEILAVVSLVVAVSTAPRCILL